ncbi:hypothetical protein Pint_14492 [Pistacia integerrima]|uniref:Uncharacterized protein n=1 Tax=Pistacia integerrima TaxID=434235 RepID=A0ACC0Y7R1_9ROSI|nr:hypothetical protein Pint_14492 [Pistacia integerrima]
MIIKKEVVWLNQSPYPITRVSQTAYFTQRQGLCGYGSNCRFNHPTYAMCEDTGDSFDLYYGLFMYNVKAMEQCRGWIWLLNH